MKLPIARRASSRGNWRKQHKAGGGLRIAVKAGGCSGFSYTFAWDDAAKDTDQVFEGSDGAKVFVDPRSLKLLDGTVLDFDEHNLLATSFTLKNPHAKQHVRLRRDLLGLSSGPQEPQNRRIV